MKLRIVSLGISLLILFTLIYFSNVGEVVSVIIQANPFYILAGFLVSVFLMVLRVFRWKVLLRRLNISLGLKRLFPVFMSSLFISNITPAKSGDPVRSYFLKKKTGLSFSRTIPSVVVERMLDVVVLIVMSVIGLVFIPLALEIQAVLFLVVLAYIILIVLLLWFGPRKEKVSWFFKMLQRVFRWVPKIKQLERKTEDMALDFKKSFIKYRNQKSLFINTLLSFFVWVLEGIIIYISFLAIGQTPDWLVCVFIMSVSVLVGVASSLPGGLGSSEIVMVLLFTSLMPVSLPIATGAVLLSRLLSFWLNLIVGALFFNI